MVALLWHLVLLLYLRFLINIAHLSNRLTVKEGKKKDKWLWGGGEGGEVPTFMYIKNYILAHKWGRGLHSLPWYMPNSIRKNWRRMRTQI
jgi:hypothetical protein